MKTNIFRPILFVLMAVLTFSACMKDLGNYDYVEINALEEITGLPTELNAIYGQDFKVTPELKFSLDQDFDESAYNFEWSYIGSNGLGGTKLFTWATTRDLEVKMTLVAGNYTAYYSVTDKASGVKYSKKFTLKVANEINEGWIMMNEVNGTARVDMLSVNSQGNFELIRDLLQTTGAGLQLEGKPVMTYTYATGLLLGPDAISYGLYLGTDKGTTKVDPNTFKWTPTMNLTYEMFGEIPDGFYADVIQSRSGGSAYMIGNNNIYFYYRTHNIYYSAPISYVTAEERGFEAAPFIGGDPFIVINAHAIFYDKTNRRFVKHSGSNATCTTLPDPPSDQKLFSFNTGMDLDYMRWVPFNGGEIFSILKDPNSNKKYLARFNSANNVQSYYSEMIGTDIADAEFYAISPEFGYIFYTIAGKVYEYDMIYKTSKLMLDFGSSKISYLNFYDFKNSSKYPGRNKLMVGTYNPTVSDGTEGVLGIYTVPGGNGDLVLDQSYSGFGRIKSLTYRER
ncbi:hypothetical protein FAZ19_19225 [Sphingobacterium alkalisoli]|uniref:PKD-like family protein n=1 Tax=Sphingobacterium alkalisoli TaxID=1874115 RepID=A0A4U0GUP4_9SPHI|nr:PKD-like family lipoprotein [Sphingobacterium alkalisoli]TJY62606.1 hypothetical protein FAZ19_19225 [Sphingobacterium alkalisoli]